MEDWLLAIIIILVILLLPCCMVGCAFIIYGPNHSPNSMEIAQIRDLKDKIVIITGANSGIGKQTALVLALSNSTVIMACRNIKKALTAQEEIIENSKNNNIFIIELDLSSFKSINTFVTEFKSKYSSLDILMCNAGIWLDSNEYRESEDGFELTFGVNHLGHMNLALQLKDLMSSSNGIDGKSRLVVTSSIVHELFRDTPCCCCLSDFDVNNLDKYNKNALKAYGHSKLCNIMFAKYFNLLYGEDVIAVSVHPGIGVTGLSVYQDDKCFACFNKMNITDSLQQLAYTQCWCAITDLNNLKGGEYYRSQNVTSCKSSKGRDIEQCKLLWDISLKMINNAQQKLLQNDNHGHTEIVFSD